MELVQLVYHSRPTIADAVGERLKEFRAIHSTAVTVNRRNNISGFLVFTKTHFIQVLEGDRQTVMATFERIRKDKRHSDIALLDVIPCPARVFPNWAMGAVHSEIDIKEAMLNAGIGGDLDVSRLSARQLVTILAGLSHIHKSAAA
jgi:hypothetical protein